MGGMSRREFGWLATELGIIGVSGAVTAGCSSSTQPSAAPSAQPTRATTPAVPQNPKPRPTKLTQPDLDRIIGNHANTLLDHLRAKAPGLNHGVAVAFAYPNHQFTRFYIYGTVAEKTPPTERTIFGIASITKTFTAALFANGVSMRPDCFDWDAGLERYLSRYLGNTGGLSPTMQRLTPRMLAQHTSGLPRQAAGPKDGIGLFREDPSRPPANVVKEWHTHDNRSPAAAGGIRISASSHWVSRPSRPTTRSMEARRTCRTKGC